MANEIGCAVDKKQFEKRRVGVVPFVDRTGKGGNVLDALTDLITNELVRGRHVLVVPPVSSDESKSLIVELQQQAEMKDLKAINPGTIKDIHEKWGVDSLLIGRFIDMQSAFGVSCRLYDWQRNR